MIGSAASSVCSFILTQSLTRPSVRGWWWWLTCEFRQNVAPGLRQWGLYGKQDEDVPAKLSPVDERVQNLISVGVIRRG